MEPGPRPLKLGLQKARLEDGRAVEGTAKPPCSHSNRPLWGNQALGGPTKETKAEKRPGAHGVSARQAADP